MTKSVFLYCLLILPFYVAASETTSASRSRSDRSRRCIISCLRCAILYGHAKFDPLTCANACDLSDGLSRDEDCYWKRGILIFWHRVFEPERERPTDVELCNAFCDHCKDESVPFSANSGALHSQCTTRCSKSRGQSLDATCDRYNIAENSVGLRDALNDLIHQLERTDRETSESSENDISRLS